LETVHVRLNTWEGIIAQLRLVRECPNEEERIELLIELLINLRLLGQDECIPDQRGKKDDIEKIHAEIERETRLTLESVPEPSDILIYYTREVIKKLPVRQDSEEMIEQIRAEAEEFEEARCEDDPMRGFAGDLRKEVHRRLSPRIIGSYIVPYLELVKGNPDPIMKAGYVALPSRFSLDDESQDFIDLAQDLLTRLNYLWDYGEGNLAAVKRQLAQELPLFDKCYLRAEVEGFLEMLTPENLAHPLLVLDYIKRLATFKHLLKESQRERRIELYDFILIDLSLGRMVFLLANDLTNNHYAEVTPHNIRDALGVIRELLSISAVKGLTIGDIVRHQTELDELRESSVYDFLKAKRCLGAICRELQSYLQFDIIDRMTGPLNRALEVYEVPTSRLSPIKTRFFNNFIRRTQFHVLSEFTEKVAAAVDRELERQNADRRLYSEYPPLADPRKLPLKSCIAATWRDVGKGYRLMFGGKGNSILDMARMGLSVPPAFVLGFALFSRGGANGELSPEVVDLVFEHLEELERQSGRRLGYPEHPLLVSIRSGAPTSMPGVMATILNVGLTPEVRAGIETRRGSALASSLYRRFLENCASAMDALPGQESDRHRTSSRPSIRALEERVSAAFGEGFLSDPRQQVLQCIRLVYGSRGSQAVRAYSRTLATNVQVDTAVTVQQLAFGNLNDRSLSGVVITRNPITGDDELFGEFKRNAQGEEVVMGTAHTEPISNLDPGIASELERCKKLLVEHYKQDLDLEFTVEDGRLFLLQARAAQLGAFANLVADTDFLRRGIIALGEYRQRLEHLEMAWASVALSRADFRSRLWNPPLTVGVPINGGVVSGTLVLTEERLKEAENRRESVVFLAQNTKPTDFAIMNGSHAIVTIYPGRTSHAAITAMSMNKPCIVGCDDVEIDYENRTVVFHGAGSVRLREGERVTADGNTGAVYRGVAPISEFFLSLASVSAAIEHCRTAGEAARIVQDLIHSEMTAMRRKTDPRRQSLDNVESLEGKRVLVRVDANIDISEGRVLDERRVLQIVPTLRLLLDRGATLIVCSHLGDPGAKLDAKLSREEIFRNYSLKPVGDILRRYFGERLVFHESSVGASGLLVTGKDVVDGAVNLLENLRFATGEKDNDEAFARSLARLSDGWFVNDAFNVCHRRHASITGVPRFVEHRLAGPLVARELSVLATVLDEPERPFLAVFGGGELETQFGVMAALLPRLDGLAILAPPRESAQGDALAKAKQRAMSAMIKAFLADYPDKVIVATPSGSVTEAEDSPKAEHDCLVRLARRLDEAKTVLWSGPAGLAAFSDAPPVPENCALPIHELSLHRAIRNKKFVMVLSEEEKQMIDIQSPSFHLSSGPRAFLEYLERLSLPGVMALDPAEE
jgi:3-phosphoglycerate kinase/phosphohistidine swiveling domain-containing protein